MDEVLKPCPFCRREAILDGERGCWAVFCPSTNHEAATRHFVSKAEAIAAWNTRADAAPTPNAEVVEDVARAICKARYGHTGDYIAHFDSYDREAEAAIAALDAARGNAEPAAWMPIETAPKDGTTIDVWRDGHRYTVYWGLPPHCCGEMGQYCDSDWHGLKEPGWICSTFGEFVGGEHHPFTHWMPLPDAPEQSND